MTNLDLDRTELPESAGRMVAGLQLPALPGVPVTTAPLAGRMAYHEVPGVAVAVLRDGEIAWAAGFGVRAAAGAEPVTERTLFQAASISKPVTALAVLRLAQDGRIDLDTDVNAYLMTWRVPPNDGWQPRVSLRQLLSHTAGTTVHGFPGYHPGRPRPTLLQILDGKPPANTPPVRVSTLPGTLLRYSGGGTLIVQLVLEHVTGQAFADLMRDLVLAPLGMQDSTFAQPLPASLHDRAATGHRAGGAAVAGNWHVYPEQAAAGLWTTPGDLLRVALEVQRAVDGRGTILTRASAGAILTHGPVGDIGIGFFSSGEGKTRRFCHGGGNEGFKSVLDAYVEHGDGVAVMANGDAGSALIDEIVGAVVREEGWPVGRGEGFGTFRAPRATVEPDQAALAAVAGTYEVRPDYLLTLRHENGRLLLVAPEQPPVPLRMVDGNRFEAATLDLVIAVERDGDRVAGIILRQGDDELEATRTQ